MHFSFDINWVVWCRGYLYYFLRKLNRKIWIGYPIYRQWVSDSVGESVCLSELGFCSIYIFTVRCHSVQATRLELWISSIWQISITSSCFPPAYHDVDKDSDICTILVQRLCQNLTTDAIDLWVKDGVSYSNILRFAFFINFPLYFF